ncbi:non-green plastid inner envelope membrane protein [Musa troglodytarum]|uniref:Non-green plastid inner envelope membrane protein n=1 Tax=Musa troglodytarum TaxID=320322 RepID=A0A9E7FM54_9LILI|nr:non-green plastid inner envelope membrane protein [Musa troglodytarum]
MKGRKTPIALLWVPSAPPFLYFPSLLRTPSFRNSDFPMAASLRGFVRLRNPNPNLYATRPVASFSFPSGAVPRRLDSSNSPLSRRGLGTRLVLVDRRPTKIIPLAASDDEPHLDIKEEESDAEVNAWAAQEQWKAALEHFKTEALKVKAVSEEAYGVYSKKAMEILMDTSEKLKIQADKAHQDLSMIAKEISQEGNKYLAAAAKNSPDSVKDILETYASVDELKNMSSIRDFYFGIPYAISAIIFCRQWLLCSQRGSFPNLLLLLVSGMMVGFYAYRIIIDHYNKGSNVEQSSES